MTTYHVAQSIAGCLRNNPVGTIDFIEDGKGNILSDANARIELNKLLEQGQKLLPTSDDCEGFDAFGKGCPGHEPLTGSELTRAMLKRGDLVIVRVSDESDERALEHYLSYWVAHGIDEDSGKFLVNHDFDERWPYAVSINPKTGKPLTAKEAGF